MKSKYLWLTRDRLKNGKCVESVCVWDESPNLYDCKEESVAYELPSGLKVSHIWLLEEMDFSQLDILSVADCKKIFGVFPDFYTQSIRVRRNGFYE